MMLHYANLTYFTTTTFAEKDIPKIPGFRWNRDAKRWETKEPTTARKLLYYADEGARLALDADLLAHDATIEASRAVDADLAIPCPDGLAYRGFQKAGIAFVAARPSVLIGDEMGTGKTIQTCGLLNLNIDIHSVLVVCPASLKLNWQRELERWILPERDLHVIIPTTSETIETLTTFWNGQGLRVAIVNYDILHTFVTRQTIENPRTKKNEERYAWQNGTLDLLVSDEAHYLKNDKARRSKVVRCIPAHKKVLLTGTPLTNRPKELFPILNYLDAQAWPNFFKFASRYCNAHQIDIGRGRTAWDFDGASHLDELQDKLRSTLMIRRLKKDVLSELPAKQRQVLELPANGAAKYVAAEQRAWTAHTTHLETLRDAVELAKAEDEDTYEAAVAALRSGMQAAFTEMSRLRHATAVAKIPQVLEHVEAALENEGKCVIFAHHHDVIAALADGLQTAHPVCLTGETPMAQRQANVDRFQTDPACRVFIGSITAAGVGLTLTAASHVVFGELDWVPGNLTQAEDRCHRIGQQNHVLVQHLVLEGSLDATMARRLVAKQTIIDQALDVTGPPETQDAMLPVLPTPEEPATGSTSRQRIAKEAPLLSAEEIAQIHTSLQRLAAACDGAQALDGYGFNKIDTHIGHSLAAWARLTPKQAALGKRLVIKYQRQLREWGIYPYDQR